jgi:hypothetical protein
MTAETCERFLETMNESVFPGCSGLSEEQCERVKSQALSGYMTVDDRKEMDAIVESAMVSGEVVSVRGMTPLRPDRTEGVGWRASAPTGDTETSAAVLTEDSDSDGLPDDLEELYGSDPMSADSDGDGVKDSEEVVRGSDPKGEGRMERSLTPTEVALATGAPLGQPLGSGDEDEQLEPEVEPSDEGVILTGRCEANSVCLLYVYTYVPMVYVAKTDELGNFRIEVGDSLLDGEHTVYVALTDDEGQVTRKSSPLSLFVREARAVTEDEYLNPYDIREETLPVDESVDRYTRAYLLGALLLVTVSLVVMWVILDRRRRRKDGDA